MSDPATAFRQAMRAAGIETEDRIVADGELHRIHVEGDRSHRRNGWYILHPDDPAAGAFGCWKRGISETWCAAEPTDLSGEARERWRRRVEERRRERKRERRRKRERARRKAARLLEEADPADPEHPYLAEKGVRGLGIRQLGSTLLVPVYGADGQLRGLQRIAGDGRKRFLAGTEVTGGYLPLGGKPNGRLIVAEGFSTAATLQETTGEAVACAFNAGNLEPVARALRSKLDAEVEIVVAADNDKDTDGNPGVTKATEAARAVDGSLAVPEFAAGEPGTDFNDLADHRGQEAVRAAIAAASSPGSVVMDALHAYTHAWERQNSTSVERSDGSGHSGDAAPHPWREPIPLGPEPPADLPAEVLPSPLRSHVTSVAAYTQTPVGLPLTVGLAAVSTAIAGKVEIEVRRGWREPVNLYMAAVLDPANRKSPVERAMAAPIREYEREGAREVGPEQRAALDRKEALEKRLSRFQKAVSKADTTDEEGQALSDLEDARKRIEALEIPTPPRLLTDDVTPEALGRIMADNAGRASIISSEGDVLRIFAGRYSSTGDPTLDIIKKAWSGDPVRVDRVGRDGVHLPRPLLTVGLTVQPTLLATLGNREVLDGEGVMARFLWMAPPSLIGERLTGADVPPPDEEARETYERLLRNLLAVEPSDVDEAGEWTPHVLELAPGARDRLYTWESEVEAMLADGGELAPIRSWGGKLVGTTVRLAGVLHVVGRAGRKEPAFAASVSPGAMERAIRLARSFVPHARHVLAGEVGMDAGVRLARYALRRIQEADDSELTVRDLWQLTRGKAEIEEVADLRDVLRRLEAHRIVRVVDQPSDGPGRPPSPWVRLSPRARENIPNIPRTPPREDSTPLSGDSGDVDRGVSHEPETPAPSEDMEDSLAEAMETGP